MKLHTALLLFLAFVGFGEAFSQGLLVTPTDTFTFAGTLATENDSHEQNGYFMNNSGHPDSVYWRVTSASMDSTWQMSFCDPLTCYYFSSSVGSYASHRFWADTGMSNEVRFGVTPYCSADSGELKVVAWLANDSAASSTTIYYFANYNGSCASASAINNVAASPLRIFPSPVSSSMTISGMGGIKNAKISVYDVLGRPVIEMNLVQPAGQVNVNTEQLNAGIYIVSIQSEGTTLLTKRIEKTGE